eukprot:m.1180314 g.1180314  ORF g.1180314 m.1180314 type:complete len:385 (-) comp24532_c0_seq24:3234-4388(-)
MPPKDVKIPCVDNATAVVTTVTGVSQHASANESHQSDLSGLNEAGIDNKRQLAREHNKRKKKRRQIRAWDELHTILLKISHSAFKCDPVRELVGMDRLSKLLANGGESTGTARRIAPSIVRSSLNIPEMLAKYTAVGWTSAPNSVMPAATNWKAEPRIRRKRLQVEGFVHILSSLYDPDKPLSIVDYGCGSGNLTVPLAWHFPKWTIWGVDMKQQCIDLLQSRATAAKLPNLHGLVGMVHNVQGLPAAGCDVVIALHACGSATDDALRRAVAQGASFVVSPCCIGKIEESISQGAGIGVSGPDFAILAQFADHNSTEYKSAEAKQAKHLIECDRLAWARTQQYTAAILPLTPDMEYSKNDVLVGTKTVPHNVLEQILVPIPEQA